MPVIGAHISHYRLVRRLGAGGMGEVFLAHDTTLNRPVAIKFLVAPSDDHARQRLLREARAVAALEHPAICGVYEVGTDTTDGDFIVMPFIDGESLAARLRRGRLPPGEALGIAAQIADALRLAHEHGIIHRDLKPHNIVITPAGAPKLLDFGLVRHLDTAEAADTETASRLTEPFAMVGTPGYMAPEQIRGKPADARSDVFALGCVLYETLTGHRAFEGATSVDIHARVLHTEPPPPSSIVPELGAGHDALCAQLLAKPVDERCQSAAEALGAIRAITRSSKTADERPPASQSRSQSWATGGSRRPLLAILALAAVTLAGGGAWFWSSHGSTLPPPSADAQRWYTLGVEALRNETYAVARTEFESAIALSPEYVQARSRLADADSELDDERDATAELVSVERLVPDRTQLPLDDRLELEAVLASVQRQHDDAIATYTTLAGRHPDDASRWLDLARAEEAAWKPQSARVHYGKALALNHQYAPANLRLGVLLVQQGDAERGLSDIENAVRIYHASANVEGEAEAVLRQGLALSTIHRYDEARAALTHVIDLAADTRFQSQRLRARFELANMALTTGQDDDANRVVRASVDEAIGAGLDTLAADGLISLANALMNVTHFDQADESLTKAITLASGRGATLTEMRARLQRASLRVQTNRPAEAASFADAPLRFFTSGHYVHLEADAKSVLARADATLERYDDSLRLDDEAIRAADTAGDRATDRLMKVDALETQANTLKVLGRLPEALVVRNQVDQIRHEYPNPAAVPFDMTNRAEVLILLGRRTDAGDIFHEIDQRIAAGDKFFLSRARRLALLRALVDATSGQFTDIERHAPGAAMPAGKAPDGTAVFARLLTEYGRARLGTSRADAAQIAHWPLETSSPADQRELSYWAARTLLARREYQQAYDVAYGAWSAPAAAGNLELGWRLAAVATAAESARGKATAGARIPARTAADDLQQIQSTWADDAVSYLKRGDLTELRQAIH